MAAYAYTIVLSTPTVKKVQGYPGLGMLTGTINITNYNQTTVPEVVEITKKFKTTPNVVCSGVANGAVKELVRWNPADVGFRCYVPTTGAEVATDVNVGSVDFIAFGQLN